MSAPVKVGVVGVGHMGKEHARIYAESAKAELVGVFDTDPHAAKKIAVVVLVVMGVIMAEMVEAVEVVQVVVLAELQYKETHIGMDQTIFQEEQMVVLVIIQEMVGLEEMVEVGLLMILQVFLQPMLLVAKVFTGLVL